MLCCAVLWWHAKPKRRKAAAVTGGREGGTSRRVINELSPRDTFVRSFVPSLEEYFKCYRLTGQTDERTERRDGARRAMSNFIQRSNEERKCVWEGWRGGRGERQYPAENIYRVAR